jgi:hypothetical protein
VTGKKKKGDKKNPNPCKALNLNGRIVGIMV